MTPAITERSMASRWVQVAGLSDLAIGSRALARVEGIDILVLRTASGFVAMHNVCTHLGRPLQDGRVLGSTITCPFHGACFDLNSGTAVSGPAVHPLHLFPARVEGQGVLVDIARAPRAKPSLFAPPVACP